MSLDDIAADALDDILLPPVTDATEKKGIKFQPKSRIKPKKSAASVSNPSNGAEMASSVVEMQIDTLETTGVVEAAEVVEAKELIDVNEELTHEVACEMDKQGDEVLSLLTSIEPSEDIFTQHGDTASVKNMVKFQPNPRSRRKVKKSVSVSFNLPNAAETDIAFVPSSLQMLNDEDQVPLSTSEILDDMEFQLDHGNSRNEELADLSGLESFDGISSESISVTNGAKDSTSSQWDDPPMDSESFEDLNHCIANSNYEQTYSIEMPSLDARSPAGDEVFETIDSISDSENAAAEPYCNLDVGINGNMDVENLGEDHRDNEHSGEGIPKQKKQRKRSKRQMKDSKEPDSAKPEPLKKRFPHGARRKRRQVDKVLLETPEFELNRRQIAIKQLILLGEAREKISGNEAAAMNNNQSNTGSFSGGTYFDPDNPYGDDLDPFGEEEHLKMLRSSQKINYMTHMAKPQRGRWSKAETELFYEAIRQFGTDFGMIVQLFPNRTREQVKLKFKLEERKYPLQIRDAMCQRSGDHSHYEKVIQVLQAQAEEEESRQYNENSNSTTTSQSAAANGNEEQTKRREKEEKEANGFDIVGDDLENLNEWDAEGITNYDEYESVELDGDGSFAQDEKKHQEFEEIF